MEYTKRDALASMDRDIAKAEADQDFTLAEKLRQRKEWFDGGCVGREPKIPLRKRHRLKRTRYFY